MVIWGLQPLDARLSFEGCWNVLWGGMWLLFVSRVVTQELVHMSAAW